jgi:hypothetical protein
MLKVLGRNLYAFIFYFLSSSRAPSSLLSTCSWHQLPGEEGREKERDNAREGSEEARGEMVGD